MDEHTSSGTRCKNTSCGRLLAQAGGGHRQREYCDDTCRQTARRHRVEQAHREEVYQRWAGFPPETQVYLDWLMGRYGEELANGVAVVLVREMRDQRRMAAQQDEADPAGREDLHNIEAYQEKLAQAGQRVAKLEKQVEIQRQRLGQYYARFYPSSLAVAAEKLLALGAALGYKPLLKYDEMTVGIAAGAQAWQEFARTANYDDMAQAILQAQRFQQQLAECNGRQAGEQEAAVHRLIVQEYAARLYLSFCEEPIPFHRNGTTYSIVTGNLPNHKVVAQLGDKQYETLEISEQEAAYFQEYCYRQLYQTYQARVDV